MIRSETFANVRASLDAYLCAHHAGGEMLRHELCKIVAVDRHDYDEIDRRSAALVFDWQRSNRGAHCVRYAHNYEGWKGEPAPEIPTPAQTGTRLELVPLYKALQCIRYNCDSGEGSGDALKPSLDVLDALIDALAHAIIHELPAYKQADWPL